MRAVVCNELGSPDLLSVGNIDLPPLAEKLVRVAVKTAGLSFVDGLLVMGEYQIKVPPPFTPGSDFAGEIVELGADVDGFGIGDRVMGSSGIGACSEQIQVSAEQLKKIPEGMSDLIAATFIQAYGTAYLGLVNCGGIQAGETVLVLGAAGGTGIAAIHISKALGARVIAAASSEEKLSACLAAGADEAINYEEEDLKVRAKELGGGIGVDIVFDPVGGGYSESALRACAPGGRFLVVGFAAGTIPKFPINLPLLKRCSVVGVNWGATILAEPDTGLAVEAELLRLFEQGQLKPPPITVYPLEGAGQALSDLHSRKLIGRAVVRVSD